MKKLKILTILSLFLMIVASFSLILSRSMGNLRGNSSGIYEIESEVIDIDLSSKIPIFGYRFNPKNDIQFERDEDGVLKIQQNGKGIVDINVNTKFGKFSYEQIKIEKEHSRDDAIESRYEIESPEEGFFMEFHIMTDYLRINLAFHRSGYQYSYDGVVAKDFLNSLDSMPKEQNQNIEYAEIVQNFRVNLRKNQIENILTYERETVEEEEIIQQAGPPPIYLDTYGIIHECYDFEGNDISDDIWDDYLDPDTSIEYGIYRFQPSESQVKSDLQNYNDDFGRINPPLFTQDDILAYHIDAHGGPEWYLYEWQEVWEWIIWPFWGHYVLRQVHIGTITPAEIEGLWGYQYVGNGYLTIYPNNMLLMAAVCYGYYYPPSTNPTMAKAFVDYGANAFVGSTISIPADLDVPMDIFWGSLCEESEQVGTATDDMCDGFGWTYGTDWKIYGDIQSTLPD